MKSDDIEKLFKLYVEGEQKPDMKKQREKADSKPKDGKISKYEKNIADKIADNDDDEDTHACALKVDHHAFGVGDCIYSEHATPDANGYVSWYNVKFPHGEEVVNTADVNVLSESHHGKH